MENPGPQFLNEVFKLNKSPEIDAAVRRTEVLSRKQDPQNVEGGEKVPQNVEDRVQNYLDRLQFLLNHEDPQKRERARSLIRQMLHDEYIVTPDQIVDYRLRADQRIARQQGHGNIEITPDTRNDAYGQLAGEIKETIDKQTASLDAWMDYLLSEDASYPDWFKYYAFRSILSLTAYNHQKGEFPKRSTVAKHSTDGVDWTTLREFPELNREALGKILEEIENKHQGVTSKKNIRKLLQGLNFAKLYATEYGQLTPVNTERLVITDGRWVKFKKGSDHKPLLESLQGHGTGWCTAIESFAKDQLEGGDFYVYYSMDEQGKPTIPRVAIRMEGDGIAEVRGIANHQNLDPYIGGIVQEKLAEFPDGKAYEKKTADMRRLTTIENRMNAGRNLTKDELIFLYEINGTIEGFGYLRDPRIAELRKRRDLREDAPIVLDCDPEEITWNHHEVSTHTKTYIGPLFPGIFKELSGLEHIHTSISEKEIIRDKVVIGDKDREQLLKAMEKQGIYVSPDAQKMIEGPGFFSNPDEVWNVGSDFTPYQWNFSNIKRVFEGEKLSSTETVDIVRLKVRDLGFTYLPTTAEIFTKAEELGLEPCPAEVGPQYLLQQTDQPMGDRFIIGMNPLIVSGDPCLFSPGHNSSDLGLYESWGAPSLRWFLDGEFAFRFRKNS